MAGRAASKRRGHKLVLRGHRALRVEPQHRKRRPRARAPWKQGPDQRRDSASGGSLGLDGRAQARGPRGNASGRSGAERAVRRTQCARGDFRGTSRKRKRPGRQRHSTARAQRHHPPGALSGKNKLRPKAKPRETGAPSGSPQLSDLRATSLARRHAPSVGTLVGTSLASPQSIRMATKTLGWLWNKEGERIFFIETNEYLRSA